jgi:hypothetical protein
LVQDVQGSATKGDNGVNRFEWLANVKALVVYVTKNDGHEINYQTAAEWIDQNPEDYADVAPAEIALMKETNSVWTLQIYPKTPIGFYVWRRATLEACIDAAMAEYQEAWAL